MSRPLAWPLFLPCLETEQYGEKGKWGESQEGGGRAAEPQAKTQPRETVMATTAHSHTGSTTA